MPTRSAQSESEDRRGGSATLSKLNELIHEGGFLFVSNDDQENHDRRKVCDDLFGEENSIAQFVWNTEGHTGNQFDAKVNHEYVIHRRQRWWIWTNPARAN